MNPELSLFPTMAVNIATSDDGREHRHKQRCKIPQRESYAGGKAGAGVYQSIINLMPPHDLYIEAFLGAGAVMLAKKPACKSIGIDLDPDALARWRGDEAPNFELVQADALSWLSHFKLPPHTLVYADPPYLMNTRRQHRQIYRCELSSDEAHTRLLDVLLSLKCMVMLSGYDSPLYNEKLSGWRRAEFYAMTRGGSRALEIVWMNFPEPLELHDYKFLGSDFRARERIKRKGERWKAKLLRMPALERHAILSAIQELRSTTSPEVTMTPGRELASSEMASIAGAHRQEQRYCSIAGGDEDDSQETEVSSDANAA